MDNNSGILLVIVIIYAIGSLIYKYYLPKIKGVRGENSIARLLRKLNQRDYIIFNDIYLIQNERSTQIDHLVISVYGIFVIETKNYDGWIHGNEKSEFWTQTFYKKKKKFRNPIKQNWAHVFFLKDILSTFNKAKYYPIIVFVGDAKLKNVYSDIPVVYKRELLEIIKENRTPCLSGDQIESIAEQINKHVIRGKNAEKQHKKYVKRNIKERREKVRNRVCPNCNSELVVRKGKFGKFLGCSNYPSCKFSAKI